MKNKLTLLAISILASSALAQNNPPAPPDVSKKYPVGSPNRIQASALATSSKGGGGSTGTSTAALLVVDSTGKTLGRYAGGNTVLLSYNNQPMAVQFTGDWNAQQSRYNSGGFIFTASSIYYPTLDCSGSGYNWVSSFGTPYVGVTVFDGGQYYAQVTNPVNSTNVPVNSFYDYASSTCYGNQGGSTYLLAPVEAVVPLGALGTPPFFLK